MDTCSSDTCSISWLSWAVADQNVELHKGSGMHMMVSGMAQDGWRVTHRALNAFEMALKSSMRDGSGCSQGKASRFGSSGCSRTAMYFRQLSLRRHSARLCRCCRHCTALSGFYSSAQPARTANSYSPHIRAPLEIIRAPSFRPTIPRADSIFLESNAAC
ncbi:hypothetical protein P280DRAFT_69046 [Massarina eburnea CBS 473.64]|uniref:Uncharacterized protein n=1 Tax=Massarina eburnea CBS 473.64 TaxID=1395130 RepID=A0A6A6RUN3_9PLEO|nr:hypothetical protein P280DRAFT_69046 [Massarina eburnea CBS 473.64]